MEKLKISLHLTVPRDTKELLARHMMRKFKELLEIFPVSYVTELEYEVVKHEKKKSKKARTS